MKEIVFALEFKGSAAQVPGAEGKLRAKTTASSQVFRTALTAKGVETALESERDGVATLNRKSRSLAREPSWSPAASRTGPAGR